MKAITPDRNLVRRLRKLSPGRRVIYRGWRGLLDHGNGVFIGFWSRGKVVSPDAWGCDALDGLLVKRDFSADDGRVFRPLIPGNETVEEVENGD
jgi:hypothetical protein